MHRPVVINCEHAPAEHELPDEPVVVTDDPAGRAGSSPQLAQCEPPQFVVTSRCALVTDVDEPDLFGWAFRQHVSLDEQECLRRAVTVYDIVPADDAGRTTYRAPPAIGLVLG